MPRQKIEFAGHDGSQLAGLLEYPDERAKGYALFAHCFSCGKDIAAASRIARGLVSTGIAVLRFDFTGLGSSDGDFSNTNFSANVDDLVSAANFLRDQYRAPSLLVGHSLGGTAVLAAAAQIPECKAVVTIGAPAAPEHVLKQFGDERETIEREGKAEVSLGGRPFTITRQFIEDARESQVHDHVASLRKALLVMHSPLDKTVSIRQAEEIYVAAKHPKSFVSLDTADHLLTDKSDASYVATVIAGWASRYLDSGLANAAVESDVRAGQVVVDEHNHQFARVIRADHQTWLSDEPASVGGQELGPDPYEQLLAALGACTSMTLRMYASRKNLALEDVSINLTHNRTHVTDCEGCEASPMKLETITRDISLTGNLSEQEKQKLMEIADKCPVHRTLTGELRIEKTLES